MAIAAFGVRPVVSTSLTLCHVPTLFSVFAVLALCSLSLAAPAQAIQSTFEGNCPDGWTSTHPTLVACAAAAGGNPGSYLRFDDSIAGNTFIIAPQKFLGDWSALNNVGSILFDHKVFELGSQFIQALPYEITIEGSDGSSAVWLDSPAGDITEWVTIEAKLLEVEWDVAGSWTGLLNDVSQLRIRIEIVENRSQPGETAGIDNVRLVPEPSTGLLLCAGLAVLGARRRFPH